MLNSLKYPQASKYLNYFYHFTIENIYWATYQTFIADITKNNPSFMPDLESSLVSFSDYEIEQAAIRLGEITKTRKPVLFDYMNVLAQQKASFNFAVIDKAIVKTREKVDEVLGDASGVTKGVVFGLVVSSFISLGLQLYREFKK